MVVVVAPAAAAVVVFIAAVSRLFRAASFWSVRLAKPRKHSVDG